MQRRPVWRRYPDLFRGAPGLIYRARLNGTRELDQAHRLILRACDGCDGKSGESPTATPDAPGHVGAGGSCVEGFELAAVVREVPVPMGTSTSSASTGMDHLTLKLGWKRGGAAVRRFLELHSTSGDLPIGTRLRRTQAQRCSLGRTEEI
jgi:hypothetical protein